MKVISLEDNFIIYILENNFDGLDKKEYVKKTILKVKDKIKKYISGYYEVNVYLNNCYGMIIEMIKKNDFDFFKDFIELNMNIEESSKMYFKFQDYFSIINKSNIYYYDNNFYVDVDKLNKRDFYKLTEFGNIIYGKELDKVLNKLSKVKCVI